MKYNRTDFKNDKCFLYRILESDSIVDVINDNFKELLIVIPEIQYMVGFEHNHPHHHLYVWNHTLLALSKSDNNFIIRLVLLLHDIGKPFSYQDEEVRHFKGHAAASSKIAYTILKRLNYEETFINYLCELISKHDTPITTEQIENNREFCTTLYKIQKCDALAHHPDKLEKRLAYLKDIESQLLTDEIDNSSVKTFIKKD